MDQYRYDTDTKTDTRYITWVSIGMIPIPIPVVPMNERDIPRGTVICCGTSPSRGISQFPQHFTRNMVYHGVICHGGPKEVPKWYITLIHWYDSYVGIATNGNKYHVYLLYLFLHVDNFLSISSDFLLFL